MTDQHEDDEIEYPKLELIVATDQNLGMGKDGKLPWNLPTEFHYFLGMTRNRGQGKVTVHASIFGHVNRESVAQMSGPDGHHPWKDTIGFVLTEPSPSGTSSSLQKLATEELYICHTFQEIIDILKRPEIRHRVDRVWVHGGSSVYKEALGSPHFHRLYWTKIASQFSVDAYFPKVDESLLRLVEDPDVPKGTQHDSGLEFDVFVYESTGKKSLCQTLF